MRRARILLAAIPLAIALLLFVIARPLAFLFLARRIAREFPGVRQISTAELASWQADPARQRPLLLDVRTAPEYAVSHLAEARRIDPAAPDLSELSAVPRHVPIVTYCAVGYRSAGLAEQLERQGFGQVFNLQGSLFAWANEGRPLTSSRGPTARVHPYSRLWGFLLKRDVRAASQDRAGGD